MVNVSYQILLLLLVSLPATIHVDDDGQEALDDPHIVNLLPDVDEIVGAMEDVTVDVRQQVAQESNYVEGAKKNLDIIQLSMHLNVI